MSEETVCFVLAGGKGTRLGGLTKKTSKPSIFFGGKYRLIDFVLSSLANSQINYVNVLIQYESVEIAKYLGNGKHWGFDGSNCTFNVLSPRQKEKISNWYEGTADAVYQNLDILEDLNPQYILIVSADHIYKMNFSNMIEYAKKSDADLVIATSLVDEENTSKFGIIKINDNNQVINFKEKPKNTDSNLASMGIYVFKYRVLKDLLINDAKDLSSKHDFGLNVIPYMISSNKYQIYSYKFNGYWRDVGSIQSLWQANMDLIDNPKALDLYSNLSNEKIYSEDSKSLPQYLSQDSDVTCSIINQGAIVCGHVYHSVLCTNCIIEKGASVENSVIMPGAKICSNAKIKNAIIGTNVEIDEKRELIFNEVTLVTR